MDNLYVCTDLAQRSGHGAIDSQDGGHAAYARTILSLHEVLLAIGFAHAFLECFPNIPVAPETRGSSCTLQRISELMDISWIWM